MPAHGVCVFECLPIHVPSLITLRLFYWGRLSHLNPELAGSTGADKQLPPGTLFLTPMSITTLFAQGSENKWWLRAQSLKDIYTMPPKAQGTFQKRGQKTVRDRRQEEELQSTMDRYCNQGFTEAAVTALDLQNELINDQARIWTEDRLTESVSHYWTICQQTQGRGSHCLWSVPTGDPPRLQCVLPIQWSHWWSQLN